MERLNGEIRDREKVFRGLMKFAITVFAGMWAYYNYVKKHGSLKGKTPAEAAKIMVDGVNKWKTMIQNASLHRDSVDTSTKSKKPKSKTRSKSKKKTRSGKSTSKN